MLRLLRCTVADPTCNKTAAKIWIRHDMGLTLTLGFCLKLGQLTSQLFKSVEKSALQSSSPFFLCWHQVDQNWDLNVYICMDVLLPFYLLTLRWTMQNISGYEPIFAFRVLYLGFDLFSACHLFSFRLEYVPLFSGWFLNFQCSFISSSSFILHDFPEMFQCVPLICLHFPWTPHHVASFCLQCFNMSTQLLFKFPAILHRFPLCCAFLILLVFQMLRRLFVFESFHSFDSRFSDVQELLWEFCNFVNEVLIWDWEQHAHWTLWIHLLEWTWYADAPRKVSTLSHLDRLRTFLLGARIFRFREVLYFWSFRGWFRSRRRQERHFGAVDTVWYSSYSSIYLYAIYV